MNELEQLDAICRLPFRVMDMTPSHRNELIGTSKYYNDYTNKEESLKGWADGCCFCFEVTSHQCKIGYHAAMDGWYWLTEKTSTSSSRAIKSALTAFNKRYNHNTKKYY